MTKWSTVLRRVTVRNIKNAVWRMRMDRAWQKERKNLGGGGAVEEKARRGSCVCVWGGGGVRACASVCVCVWVGGWVRACVRARAWVWVCDVVVFVEEDRVLV